eukprot:m.211671 g.211671  ORF g.211671 m.211671 type:complete len:69 (+) comp13785_c3_seq53:1754-1960(+)
MLSSIFFRFDFSTTLISSLGFALGSKLSTFVALRQLRIMRLLSIKKRFRLVTAYISLYFYFIFNALCC